MKFFGSTRTLFGWGIRLGVVVAGLFLTGCTPEKPTVVAGPTPKATGDTTAPAVARVDFGKAKGRWARTDGGYVLAINAVDADGRAEAAYFNPNPIKVAWCKISSEGAVLKAKAELRDVNYPGCRRRTAGSGPIFRRNNSKLTTWSLRANPPGSRRHGSPSGA